jgi:cytidylate kinase
MSVGLVIAIDGYSSCGKSTLAKALAEHYGYLYIDSGAMYRAVTWYFLKKSVDIRDLDAVQKALEEFTPVFKAQPGGQMHISWQGHSLDEEVRSREVSGWVSQVSALSVVRRHCVRMQRALAGTTGVVMDGRDIGTVVFPQADVKLFLTARPEVRAQRRYLELCAKGMDISLEEVMENLQLRDHIDSTREDSPLTMAPDAHCIDNSDMTEEEQTGIALQYVEGEKRRQLTTEVKDQEG